MSGRISRKTVVTCLLDEMQNIKKLYPYMVSSVEFSVNNPDNRPLTCGSGFSLVTDTNQIYIGIGTFDFPSRWHMYVDTSLFCEMMLAVKHEQQHVHQHAVTYKNATPDNGWFTDEHRRFESVDAMLESMYIHKAKVSQYRSHFMYTRRSPDESMDCLEEYLDSSPRSVRLSWDDMNGLEQRDFAAKVIMEVHPNDVKDMQILFSENAFPDLSDDGDLVIEHQEEIGYE